MKHISILSILIFILLVGVVSSFQLHSTRGQEDSLYIKVSALDLSEDFSRMSSKNDEVVLLLYPLIDSIQIGETLVKTFHHFSDSNQTYTHSYVVASSKPSMLFFMIELDTERSIDVIDSIVRVHYVDLRKAYHTKDYNTIQRILGDDDLIGYRKINYTGTPFLVFNFKGYYKLDKYDYLFTFQLE